MNSAYGTGEQERNRVVIVADDHQFLDTMHGVVISYEWVLANTRERLLELTEVPPMPLAFVVDLQMQSMDPLRVLELIGSMNLPAKIFLLQGADMRVLSKAKSLGANLALNIAAIVPRPLMLGNLVALLTPHAQANVVITPEELQSALREGQLLLHYQPILRREETRWSIRGAEALIRWQHPQRGLLYPGQFLRLAESSGQMGAVTDFVMNEAIRQAGEWERQGANKGAELAVSINLAPSQVHDRFLDRLMELTREHRVSPGRLTIEVIEAASLKDRDHLKEVFLRLRMQGIGLSLDDFGTGYSSLTELYRLPFTDIKIDRT